jgi:peptidoglycan/LPS O-acetylase OafA/YrhL
MESSQRVFGLDLLRAFAILTVIYEHGSYILPQGGSRDFYNLISFDGVTTFFVLSGFLIGRILLRTVLHDDFNGGMLVTFWKRRWFRTLPNYYLVLVTIVLLKMALGQSEPPRPETLPLYFVFAQNIAWPHPDFFGDAWSLTIEEWFYLCIPLPLYLATKIPDVDRRRLMLYSIGTVIVGSMALRLHIAWHLDIRDAHTWGSVLRKQVVYRMDSLMFGVLGAYLSIHHRASWLRLGRHLWIPGLVLLIVDQILTNRVDGSLYQNYFSLTVAPLATLLLLPRLSEWRASQGRFVGVITFISLISYSMYLLNSGLILETLIPWVMPHLMHVLWRFYDYTTPIIYVLYWILTIGGSFLLYRFYERPMMNLRDRWPRGRRLGPAQAYHQADA